MVHAIPHCRVMRNNYKHVFVAVEVLQLPSRASREWQIKSIGQIVQRIRGFPASRFLEIVKGTAGTEREVAVWLAWMRFD